MLVNFFKNKSGQFVITQKPNLPLIVAVFFWAIARLTENNDFYVYFRFLFLLSLSYWAYLEIIHGDSYFRRTIGLLVAIYVTINLYSLWT